MSFNSLFEMRFTRWVQTLDQNRATFNSLFEMHDFKAPVLWCRHGGSFNSLFEMHGASGEPPVERLDGHFQFSI